MSRERITVSRYPDGWRWWWTAANGKVVAQSVQGYAERRACLVNLEKVTGGVVVLGFRMRVPDGWFCQGRLVQPQVDTFVQVIP